MPFLFKKPEGPSKGIVVFTHKELKHLNPKMPVFRPLFSALKAQYLVAVHWGWHSENVVSPPWVDFHFSGKCTATFKPGHPVRTLPFNSRNFISADYFPTPIEKQWDIINVSRPVPAKRLDHFFRVIKQLMEIRPQTTVLLIASSPKNMNQQGYYAEMQTDYDQLFTPAQKENFTILTPIQEYPFGFSRHDMAYFYNASRVFSLFSDEEGQSKVISEALLCGLPVVAKSYLRGGGRDYLNDQNSRLFSDNDGAIQCFLDLLDHSTVAVDADTIAQELRVDYSIQNLMTQLESLYAELGMPLSGDFDFDQIDRKLPSHIKQLPPEWRHSLTNDLNGLRSTCFYMAQLLNHPLSKFQKKALKVVEMVHLVECFIGRVIRKLKRLF